MVLGYLIMKQSMILEDIQGDQNEKKKGLGVIYIFWAEGQLPTSQFFNTPAKETTERTV